MALVCCLLRKFSHLRATSSQAIADGDALTCALRIQLHAMCSKGGSRILDLDATHEKLGPRRGGYGRIASKSSFGLCISRFPLAFLTKA
eukprot:4797467-Amphidinium_carterae.1